MAAMWDSDDDESPPRRSSADDDRADVDDGEGTSPNEMLLHTDTTQIELVGEGWDGSGDYD